MSQESGTPPAWRAGKLAYGAGLTLDTARKMLDAGEKEAEKHGVPMAMAIVDSGGNLLAFHRMDNAILVSTNIALDKAYTAAFGKLPTSFWGNMARGGSAPSFIHERWITFPGGFPIKSNEVLLGGLGVSGGTVEDLYVAKAALQAGDFSLEDFEG